MAEAFKIAGGRYSNTALTPLGAPLDGSDAHVRDRRSGLTGSLLRAIVQQAPQRH